KAEARASLRNAGSSRGPPKSLFSGRQPNTRAAPSPALCGRLAAQHFRDAGPRPGRCIRRQRAERKETMRCDLTVRLGLRTLAKVTHHIDRDVVTLRIDR